MAKPSSHAITIPQWKYSCTGCGECCQTWHVYISGYDRKRLEALEWSDEDGVPEQVFTQIKGHDYIAHRDNDTCIFLEEDTKLCKIHKKFGINAKPVGCRVYPYNIATTFEGEYSVIPRFDCPAVRDEEGDFIDREMRQVRGYIEEMRLSGGVSRHQRDGLEVKTTRAVAEVLFKHFVNDTGNDVPTRMLRMILAISLLEQTASLLDKTPAADMPEPLKQRVDADMEGLCPTRPALMARQMFLSQLCGYLRRDEEMINRGLGSRLGRTISIAGIILGKGNLRSLGGDHPDARLSGGQLFGTPVEGIDEVDWRLFTELLRLRLQSFQFFGPTNYDLTFFQGLRSLLVTFPMIVGTAKWCALARGGECRITAEDVNYAVGAVDHSFGRSAFLASALMRMQTRQLAQPETYAALLNGLLKGG
jgi:lysine-N-methylase